jgi:hypothetical protein
MFLIKIKMRTALNFRLLCYVNFLRVLCVGFELGYIDFIQPDASLRVLEARIHLETELDAFRIVEPGENRTNRWASLGSPEVVSSSSSPSSTDSLFQFDENGFYSLVQCLTPNQKELIAEKLSSPRREVKAEQIVDLELSKFECRTIREESPILKSIPCD